MLRYLNAGDLDAAANQFDLWDHAGGAVVAGLLRRRQAETAVFNTGRSPIQNA
jgi:lysozyme